VSDELVRERRGSILVARLNRPEAPNAFGGSVLIGLREARSKAPKEIRTMVLTRTGDRAFCTGMDLRGFGSGEQSIYHGVMDTLPRLMQGKVAVPVVAPEDVLEAALAFAEKRAPVRRGR
jgi:enoyl-CoA hydratase/carnithine racemase